MTSAIDRLSTIAQIRNDIVVTFVNATPHAAASEIIAPIAGEARAAQSFVEEQVKILRRSLSERPRRLDLVPTLTHKIWLTDAAEPHLPPAGYIDHIAQMAASAPQGWTHYFWVNSDEVAASLRETFAQKDAPVVVADFLTEFADAPLMPMIRTLLEARKFVLAADIAKIAVLDRRGGVYSDLGVAYKPAVLSLMSEFDAAVVVDSQLFFQMSFLALPPNALVTRVWTAILQRPEILTAALFGKDKRFGSVEEVGLLSGLGFTAVFLMIYGSEARVLTLPYQGALLKWSSQKSWYGATEKFGNAVVRDTEPSILNEESHRKRCEELDVEFEAFGAPHPQAAVVKLLLGLVDVFRAVETPLCNILNRFGSDKAKGWHNYAYIYYFLMRDLQRQGARILEVGIGTNFTDVASSMGEKGKPGASLRAWREFFGDAEVVGADVDKRILFTEDHIDTAFVDQRQPATIMELALKYAGRPFDVIVDDGLHEYPANVNTLTGLMGALKEGGLFIIEDVVYPAIPKWRTFLAEGGYNAAIVRPRNEKNPRDNCFILIEKHGEAVAPQASLERRLAV